MLLLIRFLILVFSFARNTIPRLFRCGSAYGLEAIVIFALQIMKLKPERLSPLPKG